MSEWRKSISALMQGARELGLEDEVKDLIFSEVATVERNVYAKPLPDLVLEPYVPTKEEQAKADEFRQERDAGLIPDMRFPFMCSTWRDRLATAFKDHGPMDCYDPRILEAVRTVGSTMSSGRKRTIHRSVAGYMSHNPDFSMTPNGSANVYRLTGSQLEGPLHG